MKSYKIRFVHQQKPIKHPSRLQIVNWHEGRKVTEDDKFDRKIVFSEAHRKYVFTKIHTAYYGF